MSGIGVLRVRWWFGVDGEEGGEEDAFSRDARFGGMLPGRRPDPDIAMNSEPHGSIEHKR